MTPGFDTIATAEQRVDTITKQEILAYPSLRERYVDGDHHHRQEDGQDQELSHGFALRLHGVAFLQGVEAGVETAGGQEVVVGA